MDNDQVTQAEAVVEPQLVLMCKKHEVSGEMEQIEVHPSAVADHKAVGWKEIAT